MKGGELEGWRTNRQGGVGTLFGGRSIGECEELPSSLPLSTPPPTGNSSSGGAADICMKGLSTAGRVRPRWL